MNLRPNGELYQKIKEVVEHKRKKRIQSYGQLVRMKKESLSILNDRRQNQRGFKK